jgi:PhnB protein
MNVRLETYLNYGGTCEAAFRFYEEHLGGKVESIMHFGDNPESAQAHPGLEKSVLHARMTVGGGVLLGADMPPDRFQPMRSAYLTLQFDNDADADRIYALLSDGGEIFMKMDTTFFASRFAMLRDRFGTSWMLLHARPM